VTSGGRLAALAARHDLPLVAVPAGLQPRAAIGFLSTPIGTALEEAGLLHGFDEQVAEAIEVVASCAASWHRRSVTTTTRPRRSPVTCSTACRSSTAPASRYRPRGAGRVSLNENAETPAFFNELPELDHNELAGWATNPGVVGRAFLVLLDDPAGDERLRRRLAFTARSCSRAWPVWYASRARGVLPLARVLSSAYVGDFTSLYLALLYGIDPDAGPPSSKTSRRAWQARAARRRSDGAPAAVVAGCRAARRSAPRRPAVSRSGTHCRHARYPARVPPLAR